jgi:plastocyanin
MRVQKSILLVLLGVLVLALGGCGDDSNNDNSAANDVNQTANQAKADAEQSKSSGDLALAADPTGALKFDKTQLSASAGDATIDFTNDSSTPHNVTVEDSSGKELGKTDDITKSEATLKLSGLKAGDYTFYCSVPGHEDAGMKGTLAVK